MVGYKRSKLLINLKCKTATVGRQILSGVPHTEKTGKSHRLEYWSVISNYVM